MNTLCFISVCRHLWVLGQKVYVQLPSDPNTLAKGTEARSKVWSNYHLPN